MIVVDASAICAIALREPERAAFIDVIDAHRGGWISPLGVWEGRISVTRRLPTHSLLVDGILSELSVSLAVIDQQQTDLAFDGWRRFGKGRHPAKLNLGDCFSYALAKSRNLPLLYKGDDFAKTDVASVF